ncbi:MAG: hypothetical protein MUP16_01150 [Sedimentisphaerales bacterium]|nr:hypothetical protein [Sedimentisphaerales bacterium]
MLDLINQPFFEPFDREIADDENKDNNIKRIEQKIPVVLASTSKLRSRTAFTLPKLLLTSLTVIADCAIVNIRRQF